MAYLLICSGSDKAGKGSKPVQKEWIPSATHTPIQPRRFEAMPIRYTQFVELDFDRDIYSSDPPIGTWEAKVDQAVYSKGSKTSTFQKGKRSGIHLYVQHEEGPKIWLFVPLLPGLASFAVAAELAAGDIVEVEVEASKSGFAIVKRLQKIGLLSES